MCPLAPAAPLSEGLAGRARRRPVRPRKTATLSDGCNAILRGTKVFCGSRQQCFATAKRCCGKNNPYNGPRYRGRGFSAGALAGLPSRTVNQVASAPRLMPSYKGATLSYSAAMHEEWQVAKSFSQLQRRRQCTGGACLLCRAQLPEFDGPDQPRVVAPAALKS